MFDIHLALPMYFSGRHLVQIPQAIVRRHEKQNYTMAAVRSVTSGPTPFQTQSRRRLGCSEVQTCRLLVGQGQKDLR